MPIRLTDLRTDKEITDLTDPRYLKIDQTSPQTVISGKPIFDAGIDSSIVTMTNGNHAELERGSTSNQLTLKNEVSVIQGVAGFVYPPAHNSTYVKANQYSGDYAPYFATDPAKSLIGDSLGNQWYPTNGQDTNQRFHIDLGIAMKIDQIYYENAHYSGSYTNQGVKDFTFWGSNSATAFAQLNYATDTDWVQITTSASQFDQHVSANTSDPKYITATPPTTAYRYYAFKFANNWGYSGLMGVRRIVLHTAGDPILGEGTFVNITDSLITLATGKATFGESTGETVIDGKVTKLNTSGVAPSNGFVKTSSSDGTISIDTNTYFNTDQTTPQVVSNGQPRFAGGVYVGDGTNNCAVSSAGVITYTGTSKRHLSMRPFIEQGSIAGVGKPTIVTRGASKGYSLPLYAADEELFISEYIAGRWDGASDIVISLIGYLASAEDVDDDFALQVSWANKSTSTGIWQDTTTDVTVVTNIPDARKAQYSIYKVDFTIDWDINDPDIISNDFFAARIRRVAVGAGNTEMSGEFVITSVTIQYQVDKVYKV